MKRGLIITGAVLGFILLSMMVIPLFFKGTIQKQLISTINNKINGELRVSGFSLSLFSHFPHVEMKLEGLTVAGSGEFTNDTLISIGTLSSDISLAQLFNNKNLQITNISADNTQLLLKVGKSGAANWDIVKTSTKANPKSSNSGESNDFRILLDDIRLNKLNLRYLDMQSPMLFALNNTNVSSKGDISGNTINFSVTGESRELVFEYDSVKYISNTKLKAESQLLFNTDKMSFQFSNGKVWLNDLLMDIAGEFAMPSDSMYFDLNIANQSKDFKSILALVPAAYQSYLSKVQADGKASLSATVKGWLYNENYPEIAIKASIENGSFKYADLSEKIDHINLKAEINKPQGETDLATIDVSDASAQIRDYLVSAKLNISKPVSDMEFKASLNGNIDFGTLSKALPMEGTKLEGKLSADISIAGKQSDVIAANYNKLVSDGKIQLDQFKYESESLKQPVLIRSAFVNISTPKIEIKKLDGNIGKTHFALLGQLSNYLPYFMNNQTLQGDFLLSSDYVDLTELASIQDTPKADTIKISAPATTNPADSVLAFEIPARLDLKFRSSIKKAVYDQMVIEQIEGMISLKDETLNLSNLDMNLLQGKLSVTGTYKGNAQKQPDFNFNLDIRDADIPTTYHSFSTMRRYMPIAAKSQGTISSHFSLKGKMNKKLELQVPSLDGNGMLNTRNLMIVDSPTFQQLKGILKSEKLKNVKVDDFTAYFTIDKGNVVIKPFETQIADQQTTAQGKVSAAGELDFLLDFKINKNDLGNDINKGLDFLPGSENIQKFDVSVNFTGPVKNPKAAINIDKARKQIQDEVKKAGTKELKDKVQKLGNELKKLFK